MTPSSNHALPGCSIFDRGNSYKCCFASNCVPSAPTPITPNNKKYKEAELPLKD